MPDTAKDKELDETKRIMERLVKTPPHPKGGKPKDKPDSDKGGEASQVKRRSKRGK